MNKENKLKEAIDNFNYINLKIGINSVLVNKLFDLMNNSEEEIKEKAINLKINDNEIVYNNKIYKSITKLSSEPDGNDASNDCAFDSDYDAIKLINPYDRRQTMWIDKDGLMIYTFFANTESGKNLNQKIIWKKTSSIKNLKKGNIIKLVSIHHYNNEDEDKGIITNVDYKNGYITTQYFKKDGVHNYTFRFESYLAIFKAVYLGIKKKLKKNQQSVL